MSVGFQIDEDLAKINVDDPKYQIKQQEGTLVNGVWLGRAASCCTVFSPPALLLMLVPTGGLCMFRCCVTNRMARFCLLADNHQNIPREVRTQLLD